MSGRHRTMKHHNHSSNLRTKQLKIFWVELPWSQFWVKFFPPCFQESHGWKNPHVVRLMRHRSRHHPNLLQVRVMKMFITKFPAHVIGISYYSKTIGCLVSNIFNFHSNLGKWSNFWPTFLEKIGGWNHQLEILSSRLDLFEGALQWGHLVLKLWPRDFTSESRTINDPETLRNGAGIITPPAPLDVPGLVRCLLFKNTSFFFDLVNQRSSSLDWINFIKNSVFLLQSKLLFFSLRLGCYHECVLLRPLLVPHRPRHGWDTW